MSNRSVRVIVSLVMAPLIATICAPSSSGAPAKASMGNLVELDSLHGKQTNSGISSLVKVSADAAPEIIVPEGTSLANIAVGRKLKLFVHFPDAIEYRWSMISDEIPPTSSNGRTHGSVWPPIGGGPVEFSVPILHVGINRLRVWAIDTAAKPSKMTALMMSAVAREALTSWTFTEGKGQVVAPRGAYSAPGALSGNTVWIDGPYADEKRDCAVNIKPGGEFLVRDYQFDPSNGFTVAARMRAQETGEKLRFVHQGTTLFSLGLQNPERGTLKTWYFEVEGVDEFGTAAKVRSYLPRDFEEDEQWQTLFGTYDPETGRVLIYVNGSDGYPAKLQSVSSLQKGDLSVSTENSSGVDVDLVQLFDSVLPTADMLSFTTGGEPIQEPSACAG